MKSTLERDRPLLVDGLSHLMASERVDDAIEKLNRYLMLLAEWTDRGNIVSKSDLPRLVERHVLESIAAIPLIDELGGKDLVDIGSGGGFPGIPILIVRPELRVVLLESRRMKSLFLQHVIDQLQLGNGWVLQARAEDAGVAAAAGGGNPGDGTDDQRSRRAAGTRPARPRRFDLATARAVAAIAELTEWAHELLKPGGHLITFKGSRLEEELGGWRPEAGLWGAPRVVATTIPTLRLVSLKRL